MIRAEDLHKSYGSLRAVDGISLEVPEGELFGFLGPNGAGKTTALSMISGLLKPDRGRVSIAEIDVWASPKAAKRILGLVPQDLALYEELSARENLMFWGSLFDLPRSRLKANIDLHRQSCIGICPDNNLFPIYSRTQFETGDIESVYIFPSKFFDR